MTSSNVIFLPWRHLGTPHLKTPILQTVRRLGLLLSIDERFEAIAIASGSF